MMRKKELERIFKTIEEYKMIHPGNAPFGRRVWRGGFGLPSVRAEGIQKAGSVFP